MPSTSRQGEPLVQLTTRIPESLQYRLRLYCAEHDVEVQQFVAEAIREALRRRQRT